MKVYLTSDVHIGHIAYEKFMAWFDDEFNKHDPDAIVIVGDIAEQTLNGMKLISNLSNRYNKPVMFVLGNHDLWGELYGNKNSSDILDQWAKFHKTNHNIIYLEEQNHIIGNIGFVGTLGWYDYSLKNENIKDISTDSIWERKTKLNYPDYSLIDFFRNHKYNDIQFANEIMNSCEARLQELQNNDTVKTIVFCSHVPVLKEIYHGPDHQPWEINRMLCDSFFANFTLGDIVKKYDKVKYVICGHTHYGARAVVDSIYAETIDADYNAPCGTVLEL